MLRTFASGRLLGERSGAEEPWVLALHGWARSHADFAGVLADPAAPGRALAAVALDLPGFGATPPPSETWGPAEYAMAIGAVLDEMAPQVVVLGHSFGGCVAVHLAVTRPDRVAGLVLTGAPLYRPSRASRRPVARYRAVRALARAGVVSEARLERARQRHGSPDYRAAEGVMRDVFVRVVGESCDAQLVELACPTSLVWGATDTEVPVEIARRAAAAVPRARLEILPGIGHMTPITAPDALRAAVLALRP